MSPAKRALFLIDQSARDGRAVRALYSRGVCDALHLAARQVVDSADGMHFSGVKPDGSPWTVVVEHASAAAQAFRHASALMRAVRL